MVQLDILQDKVYIDRLVLAFFISYTVMQSDQNSSKTVTFHKPTTFEPHVQTNSEEIITVARYEYGQVGVFRTKIRSSVQKL